MKISCPTCLREFKSHKAIGSHFITRHKPDEVTLFWMKVDKGPHPKGCWLWTAALQRDGYAHFVTTSRKTISSHRYAYELLVGPVPEGMDLLHSCDERHCVNPEHLSPGTHQDNMRDKSCRGRARGLLTPDQVREIRKAIADSGGRLGINLELAGKYGVSPAIISGVRTGDTYGHIE